MTFNQHCATIRALQISGYRNGMTNSMRATQLNHLAGHQVQKMMCYDCGGQIARIHIGSANGNLTSDQNPSGR